MNLINLGKDEITLSYKNRSQSMNLINLKIGTAAVLTMVTSFAPQAAFARPGGSAASLDAQDVKITFALNNSGLVQNLDSLDIENFSASIYSSSRLNDADVISSINAPSVILKYTGQILDTKAYSKFVGLNGTRPIYHFNDANKQVKVYDAIFNADATVEHKGVSIAGPQMPPLLGSLIPLQLGQSLNIPNKLELYLPVDANLDDLNT